MFDPNNVIQSLFRGKKFICQQNSKKRYLQKNNRSLLVAEICSSLHFKKVFEYYLH